MQQTLHAMLTWYQAMGVDEAIDEAPIDRFAAATISPAPERPAPRPVETPNRAPLLPARVAPAQPPGGAIADARERARAASTLEELEGLLAGFDGCGLKRTAKSLCFARGNPQARVMLIGEAPGRDEDLQGKPFVGRAGQLLDRMLAAIGLGEADVCITNTVYWRPPGNRTPTPQEVQACEPFLLRQIELVAPKFLVLLGTPAARQLLDTSQGIMKLRGVWRAYRRGEREWPALATLHPAYLLRNPAAKKLAWRDLLMLKKALEAQS